MGGRAAGRVEVARDRHRAADVARDLLVGLRAVDEALGDLVDRHAVLTGGVGDRADLERRRVAGDLHVREVGVAELGEGVVADVEHAAGQRLLTGDGEVPGEVQAPAVDVRAGERAEQRLEVVAPAWVGLGRAVAQRAEVGRGGDRVALRVAQVTQRDDVAVALAQVLRGPDEQRAAVLRDAHVDLGPDHLALAAGGVDDDDRLVAVLVARDVGDRDGAGLLERRGRVEPRDLGDDQRAGAEAVGAVVVAGIDRLARDVARHGEQVEVDAAPGRRARVGLGEVVVGKRQHAHARVERVTAVGRALLLGRGAEGGGRRGERERGQEGGEEDARHPRLERRRSRELARASRRRARQGRRAASRAGSRCRGRPTSRRRTGSRGAPSRGTRRPSVPRSATGR